MKCLGHSISGDLPGRCAVAGLVGIALAMPLSAVSDAQAQNCAPSITNGVNTSSIAGAAASVAANVAASVVAANTAFLSQSTVFVSAPPNPRSDQPGGGFWTRGVGGQVDISSTSSSSISLQAPPGNTLATASQPCSTTVRSSFAGVQLGADISRLNINGWDIHLGATAGSMYTNNTVLGGSPVGSVSGTATTTQVPFDSSSQVPFIGGYAAVVNGGFFADFLIRADAYQMNLNSPGQNFYSQNINAHGLTVGGSVGYNYQIPNSGNWFVEPSAGFLYSKVSVDALNMAGNAFTFGTPTAGLLSGTETFDDITESIGRLGLRFGTSLSYGSLDLQPFAAVSVWHDFAGNINANWSSTPGLLTCNPCVPRSTGLLTASYSGTNIGTFGQYSVGVAGTLAKTGWVGFVRGDYRNGPNINGWDATGGLRYEFSPDEIASTAFPVKARKANAPAPGPANWSGFYVGGFGGAELGAADWSYQVGSASPRTAGILGGIDLGYNWQRGPWVFGIKGDWAWTDAKGGTACGPMALVPLTATVATPLFNMTCNAQQRWVASIAPQIGFAWDQAMMYVRGGAAFTREEFSATCNFGPLNAAFSSSFVAQACSPAAANTSFPTFSNGFSADDFRVGWTVGYGVQFALTRNWSAMAEIDYVDFGSHALTASDGTPINVGMHGWQAKLGVNYRFDLGAFP